MTCSGYHLPIIFCKIISRPRLLHFPGAVLPRRALLTREGKQPGKMRSLAHESPAQRAFSSPAPSFCVGEERALLPAFLENRFDVAKPPANGATGTREGLFSGGSWTWSGAAPGAVWGAGARGSPAVRAHTPRLRHDWLARVARHQLSCQPRGEAGLPTAAVWG